jgi:small subunit ribosomal protein S8
MVVTDSIADLIIRIKNGYLVRKKLVEVPWSKMSQKISEILVKEGFLKNLKVNLPNSEEKFKTNLRFKTLELELKYEGKKPAIVEVKRISKPGVRIYTKVSKIPQVRQGVGITIVSTPKGLMTGKQARKEKQGGEVICQVW